MWDVLIVRLETHHSCQISTRSITTHGNPMSVSADLGSVFCNPCCGLVRVGRSCRIRVFGCQPISHRNHDAITTICDCPQRNVVRVKIASHEAAAVEKDENWQILSQFRSIDANSEVALWSGNLAILDVKNSLRRSFQSCIEAIRVLGLPPGSLVSEHLP
jgi:hypothetical protein